MNNNKTIVVSHNTAKYLLMHYRQLLVDLKESYQRVVCITPEDGYQQGFAELGVEYRSIRMKQHGMNPLTESFLIKQYLQLYRELQPDHVINFSIKPCLYGGFAANRLDIDKAAYMVTGLGFIFLSPKRWVAWLRKLVVQWYSRILRDQDVLFFQNGDDAELFRELGISGDTHVRILPGTGIDLTEFAEQPLPDFQQGVTFLFIGRLLHDKGVYELVEACHLLKEKQKEFECQLLGPIDTNPSAIQRSEVDQWQKLGVVNYLGEVDDVRPFIQGCHVFVLPSYREGLPRAGLEAMAVGRAIISTDAPGCREIVQEPKNGFKVSVNNAQELADAMQEMIESQDLLAGMGQISRKICEEDFSVEKVSHIVLTALLEDEVE